jgi:hypothetical protein
MKKVSLSWRLIKYHTLKIVSLSSRLIKYHTMKKGKFILALN